MSEVEFRLSELRAAADSFRHSAQQIDLSLHTVQQIMALTLFEFPTLEKSLIALAYQTQQSTMDEWALILERFGTRLGNATDELEQALNDFVAEKQQPVQTTPRPFVPMSPITSAPAHDPRLAAMQALAGQARSTTTPEPTVALLSDDAYFSAANRQRYDELNNRQNLLGVMEQQLADLTTQREILAQDITALQNRLLTFDPSADVNSLPRIQALQTDLARMDAQIADLQHDIGTVRGQIVDLNHRLALVTASPTADVPTLIALEGSQTAEIIKLNTEGCVNYIVNKMPIPANLPRDAHLWDDMALRYPEYGIRIGDEPLVGSVIVLEREHSYADDIAGHLFYVESVVNGEVWVTDNTHAEPVRLSDLTTETTGDSIKYLYFPWHTQA